MSTIFSVGRRYLYSWEVIIPPHYFDKNGKRILHWEDPRKRKPSQPSHIPEMPFINKMIFGFSFPCLVLGSIFFFFSWGWSELMGMDSQVFFSWHLMGWGSWSWEFSLLVDFFSLFFSSVVFFISFFVFIFSATYMKNDFFFKRFGLLVILFLMSMQILIFVPHLFFLLLGWDGLGLSSFLLVIYYNNSKSLSSGLITLAYNRLGDVFFLILVSLLLKEGNWIPFFSGESEEKLVSIFLILAAMTKSAQIPFSAWLPAAMAAPTPVSALVHSSTLVTAGVFLSIRFHEVIFSQWWVSNIIFFISSLTTLIAGMCALKEFDLKKIIALSTLSNLGMMMSVCSLGFVELAFFHLVIHALFKALLFISAGYLIDMYHHSQDLRFMGNTFSRFPLVSVSFMIANGALCGLPYLAGFYSKDLVLETGFFFFSSFIMVIVYYLGLFLTVLYSFRVMGICIFASSTFSPIPQGQQNLLFYIPIIGLSILSICVGAFLSSSMSDLQGEVVMDQMSKMVIMGSFILALSSKGILKFCRFFFSFIKDAVHLCVMLWTLVDWEPLENNKKRLESYFPFFLIPFIYYSWFTTNYLPFDESLAKSSIWAVGMKWRLYHIPYFWLRDLLMDIVWLSYRLKSWIRSFLIRDWMILEFIMCLSFMTYIYINYLKPEDEHFLWGVLFVSLMSIYLTYGYFYPYSSWFILPCLEGIFENLKVKIFLWFQGFQKWLPKIFSPLMKKSKEVQNFCSFPFSSLFFLSKMSGQMGLPYLSSWGKKIFGSVENGWSEVMLPQFSFFIFKKAVKKMNFLMQSSSFTLIFAFFYFMIIIFL